MWVIEVLRRTVVTVNNNSNEPPLSLLFSSSSQVPSMYVNRVLERLFICHFFNSRNSAEPKMHNREYISCATYNDRRKGRRE